MLSCTLVVSYFWMNWLIFVCTKKFKCQISVFHIFALEPMTFESFPLRILLNWVDCRNFLGITRKIIEEESYMVPMSGFTLRPFATPSRRWKLYSQNEFRNRSSNELWGKKFKSFLIKIGVFSKEPQRVWKSVCRAEYLLRKWFHWIFL